MKQITSNKTSRATAQAFKMAKRITSMLSILVIVMIFTCVTSPAFAYQVDREEGHFPHDVQLECETVLEATLCTEHSESTPDGFAYVIFNDNGHSGALVPENLLLESSKTFVLSSTQEAVCIEGTEFIGWLHPGSVQLILPGQPATIIGTGIVELFAIFAFAESEDDGFQLLSTNPVITAPRQNQSVPFADLRVSWNAVSGASSYIISLRNISTNALMFSNMNIGNF